MIDSSIDKCSKSYNRLDIGKALKLRVVNGLSEPEIAAQFGVSKQAVNQGLKAFKSIIDSPIKSEEFRANHEQFLDAALYQMLHSAIDPKRVKKSSTLQLASAYGIFFDKQRLIRGESTANLSVKNLTVQIAAEMDRLKSELASLDAPQDVDDMTDHV